MKQRYEVVGCIGREKSGKDPALSDDLDGHWLEFCKEDVGSCLEGETDLAFNEGNSRVVFRGMKHLPLEYSGGSG